MHKFTRFFQASTLAVAAVAMLAGPCVMTAHADDAADQPVLAGPKADKKGNADGKRFNGEHKRGDAIQKLLVSLNLTEDQKAKVKDIMVEAHTARQEWQKANGEQLKAIQKEMTDAKEAKDKDKMKEAFGKMKDLRATMPKPMENIAKIRDVLTADQQATFDAKIKELKEQRMNADGKQNRKAGKDGKDGKAGKKGDRKGDDSKKSDTKDSELDL